MKSNNNSILALQHSGGGSSNFIFKDDDAGLKSIWIEIPDYCHLHCDYCYASTDNKPKKVDQYLSYSDYEKILREFAVLGGKFVGIPGKGEPFHSKNWELTKSIIDLCCQLELELAIFTTGDAIFFTSHDSVDAIPAMEKMEYMKDKNLILLIKCNSRIPEIQNKLVNDRHNKYAQLRNRAIDILINEYHLNESHRLGIVTSVMKDNENEIVDLYNWAQEKNIIFDCDTILERGRGKEFTSSGRVPPKIDLDAVFKKLKKVGAITNCQGGTYVGSTCDRILHHLYISVEGDIFPCIGCLREDIKDKFILGNIRKQKLINFWEIEFRQKLATNHKQVFTGTCRLCQNFQDEKCYSCLGRCTTDNGVNGEMQIETQGCLHHKPVTSTWIIEVTDYLRRIRSFVRTKNTLKEEGLEYLWMPNNNIAYSLLQLKNVNERKAVLDSLLSSEKPHENSLDFHNNIVDTRVNDFSRKKHYRLSEISFPLNKCWDFLRNPDDIFEGIEENHYSEEQKNKLNDIISKSFLSNIFLSSFKILFDKHDPDNRIVRFCNFMLYDNFHNSYFYRSISSQLPNRSTDDDIRNIIIANWYEDFKDGNFWKDYCLDLSDAFSDEIYSNYELILKRVNSNRRDEKDVFDFSDFIDHERIVQKSRQFSNYVSESNEDFKLFFIEGKEFINSNVFSQLEEKKTATLRKLFKEINEQTFFSLNDSENKLLLDWLEEKIKKKVENNEKWVKLYNEFTSILNKGKASMFLNYLVFLRIVHEVFNTNYYHLIYSTNFKDNSEEVKSDLSGVLKPSGMMFCTSLPLEIDFKNELRLFISNILNPFDEFYFTQLYGKIQANRQFQEKIEAHRHTLLNLINGVEPYRSNLSENQPYLKHGINYAFIVAEDICSKKDERVHIGAKLSESPYKLLSDLCLFFKGNISSTMKLKDNIGHSSIFLEPLKRIDFITIMYNLLHNAEKSDSYALHFNGNNEYEVSSNSKTNIYEISIVNPAIMNDRVINFLNNQNINFNTFPFDNKEIKSTGGLSIIKRIILDNINNGWSIEAESNISKKQTTIILKIK